MMWKKNRPAPPGSGPAAGQETGRDSTPGTGAALDLSRLPEVEASALSGSSSTPSDTAAHSAAQNLRSLAAGRRKWLLAAAVAVLAAGVLASRFLGRSQPAGAVLEYTEVEVTAGTITRSLTGSGTLQPANSYTVTTLVEGEVLDAAFEEGDTVEKGTVLYQVDSANAATNIEKSEISLAQAQRSYDSAADKQQIRAETAGQVVQLLAGVGDLVSQGQEIALIRDSSSMTLKLPFSAQDAGAFAVGQAAEVTLDGTFEKLAGTVTAVSGSSELGEGNLLTRTVTITVPNPGALTDTQAASASVGGIDSLGSALLAYKSEHTVNASASGTVTAVHVQEGSRVGAEDALLTLSSQDLAEQLQSASENLRAAELSMENAQKQLDDYTITSPIQGTIVEKNYKTGDTVESGKTLCVIYDLSYLEMALNVDELDISSVEVGQAVEITTDAVEDRTYSGVVTRVSVAGTTSGGTTYYPVTVRIDETDGLLPGMNVDAEIVVSQAQDVLTVPNAAVQRGSLVLVTKDSPSAANAAEDTTAPDGYVYVQVTTGISDDNVVEITSGLQEGDTVAYTAQSSSSSGSEAQMGMQMGMNGGMNGGGMNGGGMGGGQQGGGQPGGGGGFR